MAGRVGPCAFGPSRTSRWPPQIAENGVPLGRAVQVPKLPTIRLTSLARARNSQPATHTAEHIKHAKEY